MPPLAKPHPSMVRKNDRAFLTMVLVCSISGVILGGTSSWAESNSCLQDDAPTQECLTKGPAVKTVEGMSVGLVAGLGAALAATWQAKQKNRQ